MHADPCKDLCCPARSALTDRLLRIWLPSIVLLLAPISRCVVHKLFSAHPGHAAHISLKLCPWAQVLTPAVTLAVAVAIGLERLTGPLVGSVALITAGTAIAAVMESSMGSFSWVGTSYFMLSLLLEAIRVVAIQLLLGQLRFNEAEILVFLGSPASLLLLLASFLLEHKRLAQAGGLLAAVRGSPAMFAASMTLGAMVNLSTALAIRTSSGLTFKVSGCVKNAFVVFYGIFTGDHVSSTQLLGYGVSVAGFAWYARNKQSQVPARAKRVD